MGQFGPLRPGATVPPGALIYFAGALLSSSFFGLVSHKLGSVLAESVSVRERLVLLSAVAATILLIDLQRRLFGRLRYSCGLPRQTPYAWKRAGRLGVFGWGFDTGFPFTTIRSTSMPLLGTSMLLLGFGSGWAGAAYGVGLVMGVGTGLLLRRLSRDNTGHVLAQSILVDRGSIFSHGWGVLVPTAIIFGMAVSGLFNSIFYL